MDATESLKRVVYFFQIFGLSPFRLNKTFRGFVFEESEDCFRYTKIVITVATTLQVLCFLCFLYFLSANLDYVPETTTKAVIVIAWLSSYLCLPVIVRLALTKQSLFCFWLNKLKHLISDLSDKQIQQINKLNVGCVIVTILVAVVLPILQMLAPNDALNSLKNGKARTNIIIFKICSLNFYIVELENKLFLQYFLILVNMLRCYYKQTNLTLNERNVLRSNLKEWHYHLRSLRVREVEIQGFLKFLHTFFIPVVTLHMLWGFYSVFINLMLSAKYGLAPLIQILWALAIFWDCITVSCLCHITESEAEKLANRIQDLFINCDNVDVREEIELFSLQVQHQKVEFYTIGHMKINLPLIHSMLGSLISYSVIFIQFKTESPSGDVCYKRTPVNCT